MSDRRSKPVIIISWVYDVWAMGHAGLGGRQSLLVFWGHATAAGPYLSILGS